MPSSDYESVCGSEKSQLCIDASFKVAKSDDPLLTAQERVRKWLQESHELKLPLNSGKGSFRSKIVPPEVKILSEEEAEMYPNEYAPIRFTPSKGCFGMFSCLPSKAKR
jgi:hypothetical protein